MNTVIGELSLHYDGYGFVVPSKPDLPDVFVPARLIGDAMHSDVVEVSLRKTSKGLFEGAIQKIIRRGLKQIVGRLELHGRHYEVICEDSRIRHRMLLKNLPKGFRHGEYVVAKILQYPSGKKGLEGEVVERLPKRGTLMAEIEFVIAKHQLPKTFPKGVEKEAGSWKLEAGSSLVTRDVSSGILRNTIHDPRSTRKDLRTLPFVTIDGEDAKDFDDAVCAKALENGHIRLWVAIADVSYYIRPHSLLDREAYQRGTSVYFPGRVLPMLPEVLSNDLCSLKPHEDRLALVCELELDEAGEVVREDFYPAVFQSQARLTYTFVKRLLIDQEKNLRETSQNILPMMESLSEAALRLKALRSKRGSIDFDLPEPEIILDFTGGIEHIEKADRHWGHQIIEELMIAANEAVARFLTSKKVGCLYRIHDGPDPEKIRNFYYLVQRLGFQGKFHFPVSSHTLQKILNHFKSHPEERLVNTMLLRSMARAVYSVHSVGHFGLASSCYCHFTSPIRRYPDLVVHRLLKQALLPKTYAHTHIRTYALEDIAEHSSRQERKALEAEREMISLHSALFMQERIGEVFNGVISHVTKFGFFVELIEYFVEGLIPKQSLGGDIYIFDEGHLSLKGQRHKKIFKIGGRVQVGVKEVNLMERRIYFSLLEA